MNIFDKENWCRGPACKFHPNPFSFLKIKRFRFKLSRCLTCKRFVQKDFYLKSDSDSDLDSK